ncbi:hypothetical protein Y032_0062g3346 [Ancylostoma ceylanicum]|uniref:Uncharacterized protein n=1 Tax=Ancylostoma ceylanicum TaxID=53326 RepID=A0A016U1W4_9BILA|nr:hypothetical protein Y032_0062g3346 [Ancylostoma ceylanicum]
MIPCGRSDVHWLGSLYCISCFLNSNLDRLLPQLAFFTFLWCDTLLTSRLLQASRKENQTVCLYDLFRAGYCHEACRSEE